MTNCRYVTTATTIGLKLESKFNWNFNLPDFTFPSNS